MCCLIGVIELYTLLQLLLLEITLSDSFVPEYVFVKNVLCTFGAKSSLQFKLMAMTFGKLTPSPDPHKDVNYRYFGMVIVSIRTFLFVHTIPNG